MRTVRTLTSAAAATFLLVVGLGAPSAAAANAEVDDEQDHGVVDGQEYGPEEGYNVTTETYDLEPGEDPLDVIYGDPELGISPLAEWGNSYARSTETAQFIYTGRAMAAGNVYNGERIIQVCVWYSHPGRSSDTVCSTATQAGTTWTPGSEAVVRFADNLSINWPQTEFNIETTRIHPDIH